MGFNPTKCVACGGPIPDGQHTRRVDKGLVHADARICQGMEAIERTAQLHRLLPLLTSGVYHSLHGACADCTVGKKPLSIPPFHADCRCWVTFGDAPDQDHLHELIGKLTDEATALENEKDAFLIVKGSTEQHELAMESLTDHLKDLDVALEEEMKKNERTGTICVAVSLAASAVADFYDKKGNPIERSQSWGNPERKKVLALRKAISLES